MRALPSCLVVGLLVVASAQADDIPMTPGRISLPCTPTGTYSAVPTGSVVETAKQAGDAEQASESGTGSAAEAERGTGTAGLVEDAPDEHVVRVPCTPVGTSWPASAGGPYRLEGPQLTVVRTQIRPKDARLYLDGRFVGRARFFRGKRGGYLFLEPGRYRLEARMGGYRTDVFEIEATPSCRFDIRHRMLRNGEPGAGESDIEGKGKPTQWVYGPVGAAAAPAPMPPARPEGPDPSLRPDLRSDRGPVTRPPAKDASLRLVVKPETASVSLDGSYLATGGELARMVEPLAITSGSHELTVEAPGFATRQLSFEAAAGEVLELDVVLQRAAR